VLPSNPEKKLSVIQMILNPNNNTWQKNIALIIVVGLYNHSGVDRIEHGNFKDSQQKEYV